VRSIFSSACLRPGDGSLEELFGVVFCVVFYGYFLHFLFDFHHFFREKNDNWSARILCVPNNPPPGRLNKPSKTIPGMRSRLEPLALKGEDAGLVLC
jgi:hypothetical protein